MLWGGRFKKPLADEALRFSSSFAVDRRLWRDDLIGSIAHALMLGECGILTTQEKRRLVKGLVSIFRDIAVGRLALDGDDEDIHSFVERVLRERIGEVAATRVCSCDPSLYSRLLHPLPSNIRVEG
jgi:argininosuccinate lyase